jgi:arabinan endo-1,5-alpha-L-arabinosidase
MIMSTDNLRKMVPALFILVLPFVQGTFGQTPPSHDPSHMVKDGGRYWIFTTGDGIWNMSSDTSTFATWRAEPLIFPVGTWPDWINGYVPGFAGNFWAPEIIYMNGKWNLYYSCSTFGSRVSAIGLVTSPSIAEPAWEDRGMVVYSDNSSNVNAIDPDIFKDNDGKVWLIYGSFSNGIVMTEIDSTTGKPFDPNDLHYVANNGCEAGNMLVHGNFYYLFFDRGACCRGINSTYRILMGRSTSPTGPFYDEDSIITNNSGGTLFLHSDGRYIGPGHFGYGEGKLTYHYYDGAANGAALLKIATITWEDNWPVPVYSRSYGIADSTYIITNRNSDKVLQIENGDTTAGTNVAQYTESGDTSQHWIITNMPGGYYKLSPSLAPDKALEVAGCSTLNGANVQIGKYEGLDCQLWYVAYMGSGVFRFMSRHSYEALEIINASTAEGANAQQWPFNENQTQQWTVKYPTPVGLSRPGHQEEEVFFIYPNPTDGSFTIDISHLSGKGPVSMEIYSMEGKLVFKNTYIEANKVTYSSLLARGIYHVIVVTANNVLGQKLIVQ